MNSSVRYEMLEARFDETGMTLNSKPSRCEYSLEHKVIVHKFPIGSRTCVCGEVTVPDPSFKSNWRRNSNAR